ncbi:40S ribosomal protein S19, partial [Candidatus Woesearchaeota archaeon]|nr:40S ribosomal protein S19 [Candidatus Woesearchaeota archaeon]
GKNRGHKPEKFCKGSGSILRKVLQQLEAAGLLKNEKEGVRKGRVITPKGISLMDKAAVRLYKTKKTAAPKQAPQAPAAKPAPAEAKPAPAEKPAPKAPENES